MKKFQAIRILLFPIFHKILSFCLMLAGDSSCTMSGKFVQCLRGICNNQLLSKNYPVQNKNCRKVMLFRRQCTELFPAEFCVESLRQYTGFLALQCCPKSIKTTLNTGARQHRQYCTEYFTCAMFLESIKTTSNRIFSCAMLSEAF